MDTSIPSTISQLFHTNAVPSPMDVHHVHRLLKEHKEELDSYTDKVKRARAVVQCLEHQYHGQGCWDQATSKADPRMAPLLLSQVCRSWQYLLFSLPCLWTTLHLDFPTGTRDWEALAQSKSLLIHMWFSRSKALLASLFLNHAKGALIPWHALLHLDKEILALSCRLKYVSFHFSSRSLSCLLTFTQNPVPYLQHLELQNTTLLLTNENPPPIVLHSASSLKSLSLSWCSLDLRHFQIPWGQLQNLNLEYDASSFWNPVHSDYLQTLALCPNLTTLSLGIDTLISDIDPAQIKPVTLAHIHTFKSSIYVQTTYLTRFFDALHMPQLCYFGIKNVSLALGSFNGQTECF